MEVIKDLRILKAMAKRKLIKLHKDTGETLYNNFGNKVKCYYVDSGLNNFEYKGINYKLKYFSGCFCPYVIKEL